MTTTLATIKGQIKQLLQGYTRNQEQISWLDQPMTASDTTFTVNPATANAVSRGLVEIGDELILVTNFDKLTGLVNISAGINGRGREATTPAAHSVNDIVTMDPDYPQQRITEAINETIDATFPDIYVMKSFDFNKVAARYEYNMPEDAEFVIRVTDDTIGPSRVKFPNQSARFNPQVKIDPSQGFTSGKSLQIYDAIVPGRNIHVIYATKPGQFTSDADDYETVIGYPERTIDMIKYGAVARLLSGVESARLQQKSIESTERAPLVPSGAATNASQYFWKMYRDRLNEEVDRLHFLFPTFQTFNG